MPTMIQIRNVPDDIHRAAKARAATRGLTLSELALQALERELSRPTPAELAARIRALEPVPDAPSAADLIREERDAR
jgi:antitoxin FitA